MRFRQEQHQAVAEELAQRARSEPDSTARADLEKRATAFQALARMASRQARLSPKAPHFDSSPRH